MGIIGSRDELRGNFDNLAIGVAVPFVGRAIGNFIFKKMLNAGFKECCGKTTDELKEVLNPMAGDGDSGVTWGKIVGSIDKNLGLELDKNIDVEDDISWTKAADARGLNKCAAYLISTIVLIFWHWLQPFLYWLCLYLYWDLLDGGQRMLGCVVAFRELIYWLLTIIGLFTNPAYLLIDIKGDGAYAMFVYILAPEKYVYLAAVRNLKIPCNSKFDRVDGAFMLMILDVFGIAALGIAIKSGNMYPAMMIGYILTSLFAIWLVWRGVYKIYTHKYWSTR